MDFYANNILQHSPLIKHSTPSTPGVIQTLKLSFSSVCLFTTGALITSCWLFVSEKDHCAFPNKRSIKSTVCVSVLMCLNIPGCTVYVTQKMLCVCLNVASVGDSVILCMASFSWS